MYLPDNEIERVAVNMITEFGDDAEYEASGYAESARGLGDSVSPPTSGAVFWNASHNYMATTSARSKKLPGRFWIFRPSPESR